MTSRAFLKIGFLVWPALLLSLSALNPVISWGAQEPRNIDGILAPIIAQAKIPGMAAIVLHGDEIVAQGVAGVRKKGATEAIRLDDQFELSSCTKAMTATLVAMLIEEGKLHWTSPLAEIFSDIIPGIDPAWKKVTVRQLLAQRAGIAGDHLFDFYASIDRTKNDLPLQRRKFVGKLLTRAPDAPPNRKFIYSSANFILAGAILEKITGSTWEDLMRERLYDPLGLTSGGFGPPGTTGQVDQPWGHGHRRLFSIIPMPGDGNTPFDPGSDSADYPPAAGPAGMAHLSIVDWSKFVRMHLRGDPANPHRKVTLLKEETFARLHQLEGNETDYAAGWFIATKPWAKGSRSGDTGRIFFHAGDNGRWTSVIYVAPEIDFAILLVCNCGSMEIPIDQVAGALVRFAPKPGTD